MFSTIGAGALRGRETIWWVGVGLLMAGCFVMLSGDLPRVTVPTIRRLLLVRLAASPWLYVTLLASSCVMLIAVQPRTAHPPIQIGPLRRSVGLLIAGFLLSVLFSQRPTLSWFAFGCFLAVIAFGIVAGRALQDETVRAGTSIVIAAAALSLAIRVTVWRFGEGLGVGTYHIANNAWLGKLQIAWVLNLVAPLLLARFIEARHAAIAGLYGAAWLASATALHLVYSRTGSVTLALTTLGICAFNRRYWRRWLLLLGAVAAGAAILFGRSSGMPADVFASLLRADRDTGIVWRQGVWRDALSMIADHPLTGVGLGTYDDVAYSEYHSTAAIHFFRNGWHAHNVFLHVLAETGVIGFAAWSYFWIVIVTFLLRCWRNGDESTRLNSAAALGVVVAFFVLSLTEVLIAARVHASLRMNLTLALLLVYAGRLVSRTSNPPVLGA